MNNIFLFILFLFIPLQPTSTPKKRMSPHHKKRTAKNKKKLSTKSSRIKNQKTANNNTSPSTASTIESSNKHNSKQKTNTKETITQIENTNNQLEQKKNKLNNTGIVHANKISNDVENFNSQINKTINQEGIIDHETKTNAKNENINQRYEIINIQNTNTNSQDDKINNELEKTHTLNEKLNTDIEKSNADIEKTNNRNKIIQTVNIQYQSKSEESIALALKLKLNDDLEDAFAIIREIINSNQIGQIENNKDFYYSITNYSSQDNIEIKTIDLYYKLIISAYKQAKLDQKLDPIKGLITMIDDEFQTKNKNYPCKNILQEVIELIKNKHPDDYIINKIKILINKYSNQSIISSDFPTLLTNQRPKYDLRKRQ